MLFMGFKKGRIVPLEIRLKISKANRGRKMSEEWLKKIKKSLKIAGKEGRLSYWKNKRFSKTHLANLIKARRGKTPMLGKKHSEKTKKNFSLIYKKVWSNPKYKAKMVAIRAQRGLNSSERMKYVASFVKKGDQSSQWRGDKVEYRGIHTWLKKYYGKATRCENKECLGKSTIYEWAKLRNKEYKRLRINYIQLCKSCHMKYDHNKSYQIKLWIK